MRRHNLPKGYIHAMAHAAGMAAVAAEKAKREPQPPPDDNHVRPGPEPDTILYRGKVARKVSDADLDAINKAKAKRAKKHARALELRDREKPD